MEITNADICLNHGAWEKRHGDKSTHIKGEEEPLVERGAGDLGKGGQRLVLAETDGSLPQRH